MPKIGVGVGDEFPVDEGKTAESSEKPEETRDDECEHWREKRREWHRHWREHGRRWGGRHFHWRPSSARQAMTALLAIGGIALLIAIISHFFYFILGAAVLAVLFYMHRDHHGAMWDMHPRGRSAPDAQ